MKTEIQRKFENVEFSVWFYLVFSSVTVTHFQASFSILKLTYLPSHSFNCYWNQSSWMQRKDKLNRNFKYECVVCVSRAHVYISVYQHQCESCCISLHLITFHCLFVVCVCVCLWWVRSMITLNAVLLIILPIVNLNRFLIWLCQLNNNGRDIYWLH